jgi:hypothetical protein
MLFCTSPELCQASLSVTGGQIQSTASFKYLGIWFDSELSFEVHCLKLISKVKSKLYLLARYPHYRNWHERRILFFAHIYPVFLYGIECYMHCSSVMRQRLERLYRKCGRIVLGNAISREDVAVYSRLKLLPLRLLFQLRGAIFMYRVIRRNEFSVIADYFVHTRGLGRYNADLILPKLPLERSRKSFRYWGAKLWNSIPTGIKTAETLVKFTSEYELYLTNKVLDYTDTYELYDFV